MTNSIPTVLKELRIKQGKTQEEVAKDLKITQRTYSNYETGKRQPNIDLVIDIANYFNVPIDILVGRYEIKK